MKKDILSWNDVKEKYLEFHKMDSFTENMAIDVDFGFWLVNNCIIHDARLSLLDKVQEIAFGNGSAQERMVGIKALFSNEA